MNSDRLILDEGDLVRVKSVVHDRLALGIVVDIDPSEEAPTYYFVSAEGQAPDWYHEDEVFRVQELGYATDDRSAI